MHEVKAALVATSWDIGASRARARAAPPRPALRRTNRVLWTDAALEELRLRGHLAASKKARCKRLPVARASELKHATTAQAARVAAEGLVGVARSANAAVLVELNCETDFVARNAKFQASVAPVSAFRNTCSHAAPQALLGAVAASALKLDFAALQPRCVRFNSWTGSCTRAKPLTRVCEALVVLVLLCRRR